MCDEYEMKERDASLKQRLFYTIKIYGMLLICALAYAAFCNWSGYGIPCAFKAITGLSCPGCGISRMFIHMLKLEWKEAFMSNQAVFVLLPLFVIYFIRRSIIYVKSGTYHENAVTKTAIAAILVTLLVFGAVRNIR